ncbi:MAG: carboxypeptidase regulatory-like domain-containing protein [Bryobacterales bacterium]
MLIDNRSLAAVTVAVCLWACGGGAPAPETAEPAASAPAATEPAGEVVEVDPAKAATVSGKIMLEGEAPKPVRLNLGADEDCKAMHTEPLFSEQVVVNDDGSLQNVFVYVKSGLEGKSFAPSKDIVTIDQVGCVYKPHVVGVQVGQTLRVTNDDPTLHNVHPLPRTNPEFNKSQGAGAGPIDTTFSKPELMIPVKCNIHPWMRAYINVAANPFFSVTGADGTFTIKGLPAGEYTIEAVHEKYGNSEAKVIVGEGESATVDLKFKG